MPTISIEMTPQQAQRLADAWQSYFGVTADLATVKTHLVRELKAIVIHGEKKAAEEAAQAPAAFDPT